jgi:hypothetical protein
MGTVRPPADLPVRPLPDADALTVRLRTVLGAASAGDLRIVAREPLASGTFPKEIVTCNLGDGRELKLFCKYGASRNESYGHRDGVAYEAEVYRRVLSASTATRPKLLGFSAGAETGDEMLFLEYVPDSLRVDMVPGAIASAARWSGRFHAEAEAGLVEGARDFLIQYDADYFAGWARRALAFAHGTGRRLRWLEIVSRRYEDLIPLLSTSPATIVHGEYGPKNILARRGTVIPIDWESAAIGAGEIDLACLTDGWPKETVELCVREYIQARWANAAPREFERRLEASALYLHFRWLGDDSAALREDGETRLGSLYRLAGRLDVH